MATSSLSTHADANAPLDTGSVATLYAMTGNGGGPSFSPILQVLDTKQVPGPQGSVRYRIVLSDGKHYIQGMLATQLNHMIATNLIGANTIVQVEQFMSNRVKDRTVIILLNVHALRNEPSRIGDPQDIEKAQIATPGVAPSLTSARAAAVAVPAQPLYNKTNYATGSSVPPVKTGSPNPYGGPSRNPHHASPVRSSHAPIVRDTVNGTPVTNISNLNMYANKWTIQARVTSKSDIRTWSNAKGEGSLFSVELLDQTQDVRATFFKEAVDKFYSFLQIGSVYTFSGGRLKVANAQYNTCQSNFEITFDQNSEIHLANDDGNIQRQHYEFIDSIAGLERTEPNTMVDLLAVVQAVGEVATIVSKKSGQELTKCDLTLIDTSATQITLTLWGDKAASALTDYNQQPVVAIRRARVSDYGGRSLSLSGSIETNPDIPQTAPLQTWWRTQTANGGVTGKSLSATRGGAGVMESLEQRQTIADIKNNNLGYAGDKPDWLTFKATVSFLKKDKEGGSWYPACANAGEPCKNRYKVTQTTDGNWYCDKCQGSFPTCVRRWIFSGVVEDDTSSTWVSFFNEQAETLLAGATADQVYAETYQDQQDQDAYDSYFAKANHTEWIFKCKVKNEMVNEESRVKTSVVAMQPVDFAKESRDLLSALAKF